MRKKTIKLHQRTQQKKRSIIIHRTNIVVKLLSVVDREFGERERERNARKMNEKRKYNQSMH